MDEIYMVFIIISMVGGYYSTSRYNKYLDEIGKLLRMAFSISFAYATFLGCLVCETLLKDERVDMELFFKYELSWVFLVSLLISVAIFWMVRDIAIDEKNRESR